jgi:hypothetical protein
MEMSENIMLNRLFAEERAWKDCCAWLFFVGAIFPIILIAFKMLQNPWLYSSFIAGFWIFFAARFFRIDQFGQGIDRSPREILRNIMTGRFAEVIASISLAMLAKRIVVNLLLILIGFIVVIISEFVLGNNGVDRRMGAYTLLFASALGRFSYDHLKVMFFRMM